MLRCAVLALLALVSLPGAAHARCKPSGLTAWPPAGEVGISPLIAVTGYAMDAMVAKEHAARVRLLDAQSGQRVPLVEWTAQSAGYRTHQVLLKPDRPLKLGHRYRLEVKAGKTWQGGKVTADRPFAPARGPDGVPIEWRVRDWPQAAPAWRQRPVDGPIETQQFGCGPAVQARVPVAVAGSAAFLVQLEGEADAHQALVVPQEGTLILGHGMCAGPFTMAESRYAAVLVPVDAAGQEGQAQTVYLTAGAAAP
ncbi:MAG: hypothetical protein KC613_18765 [Myxococcales bacterium]|nr:hypothetical protein [Myxococcales bacterium]MCB9526559.1 hypothetical protein [Myxococcales bacterium]